VAGLVLVLVGLLLWSGAFSWFGRLPGDIRIEKPNLRVYFPITSMLILSIVLSLLAGILRRFWQ
jgi:membrane protein implicated in regulation of membrane protease activity